MLQFIGEALAVGFILASVERFMHKNFLQGIPKFIASFIIGVITHCLFEVTGGNLWFCNHSVSCKQQKIKTAVAMLEGTETPLRGKAVLGETDDGVTIHVTASGLTPGEHGFHIHSKGDLSDGCTSLCSHYNPFNKTHGGIHDENKHLGDLGNVVADKSGNVNHRLFAKGVFLNGIYSVVGRSLILHKDRDDLGKYSGPDEKKREESLKTGNAGKRIMCGVIGIAEENK